MTISVANSLANYYSQFQELAGKKHFEGGVLPEDLASGLIGPVSLRVLACGGMRRRSRLRRVSK